MKKIIYFVFIIMLAVIFLKCASSSPFIVELNLSLQSDTIIEIMPFSDAKKRLASKDFKWRGAIPDIIDRKNGLYTSFGDIDYAYLRESLIKSLQKSQSFKAIHDIQNENESGDGIRLYISFDESGVEQTSLESFCVINAYAWTEIAGDSVLSKKEIKTRGRSSWSASGAKNNAFNKFIKEVAQLISIKLKQETD